jgi:aspartate racemase
MRLKENDPAQHRVRALVVETAGKLAEMGAEGLVLCANTLHMFADDVEAAVPLPLAHIAAATAAEVRAEGFHRVGLLGTRLTMEQDFYRRKLAAAGVEALIPSGPEREWIDNTIFQELLKGIFRPAVRQRFLDIMHGLRRSGAEGIVMGCTEIPLLIRPADTDLPLFDTLSIHVRATVEFALSA